MDIHYNAFISYRHHPDDIRVASEIHRSLERFRVPKPIRKKAKLPMRLFRDKEELPITSNLNDDIGDALRNSDFLIVICSVHTKESIWVQREIELFLKSHHRSRVLTVLASGEPYDVIPEILLYEDVTDPVTGETVKMPVEPLSCDWRVSRRKAKQEELPRLAAPLLGCSYDELRQRQKQYRTRRLITAISISLAASLCLAAYFLHTSITIYKANLQIQAANEEIRAANIEIQKNLEEALRNQSQHLASAARERLTEGDRLTAIALTMAALPGEGNERPFVAEAEHVLSDALGVYSNEARHVAVGAVSPGLAVGVKEFWLTDREDILYLHDQRDIITAWDIETLQKLGTYELGDALFKTLIPTAQGHAAILAGEYGDTLLCVRSDGTVLWQLEDCMAVAYMPQEDTLLAIGQKGLMEHELLFIDPDDGTQVRTPLDLDLLSGGMSPSGFYQQIYSAGMPVCLRYYDYMQNQMCLLDMETGEYCLVPAVIRNPRAVTVTSGGKLLIMEDGQGGSMSGMVGVYEGNRLTTPITNKIYCYDAKDGTLLWESEITANTFTGDFTLEIIPESDRILCQSGAVFQILDAQTGQILARCEAGSSVISVTVGKDAATAVLQDGYVCQYRYADNYCYEDKYMAGSLEQAFAGTDYYALQRDDTQVTVYRSGNTELNWEHTFADYLSVRSYRTYGELLAFTDYDNVYLLDTHSKEVIWQAENTGTLLGFSTDGTKLWYLNDAQKLITVDAQSGKAQTDTLSAAAASGDYSSQHWAVHQDKLLCVLRGQELKLVCWDLNTMKSAEFSLTEHLPEGGSYLRCETVAGNGQYAWLWLESVGLLELDMTTGAVQTVMEDLAQRPAVAVRADGGLVAVTNLGQIGLKVPGVATVQHITLEEAKAGSVYFHGDALLALCDNGFVYRFDSAGVLLSQTEIATGDSFSSNLLSAYTDPSQISWQVIGQDQLMVNAFFQGSLIDCTGWKLRASLPGYVLYQQSEETFVCKTGTGFVGYPVYSTQALLQLGREALGSFQLTQEQKAAYGLD